MISINIKRWVAALAVTAGLLAAAGPASAQGGGADFTRFASPGPHGLSIGTTEVFELNTFGSYDPVEHLLSGNDTQLAAGGAHGLMADSYEVAVEGITLAHEGYWRYGVVAEAGAGDDTITQAREPAHTVTMLDYMGSP
jgi:hypothetical protein